MTSIHHNLSQTILFCALTLTIFSVALILTIFNFLLWLRSRHEQTFL